MVLLYQNFSKRKQAYLPQSSGKITQCEAFDDFINALLKVDGFIEKNLLRNCGLQCPRCQEGQNIDFAPLRKILSKYNFFHKTKNPIERWDFLFCIIDY